MKTALFIIKSLSFAIGFPFMIYSPFNSIQRDIGITLLILCFISDIVLNANYIVHINDSDRKSIEIAHLCEIRCILDFMDIKLGRKTHTEIISDIIKNDKNLKDLDNNLKKERIDE